MNCIICGFPSGNEKLCFKHAVASKSLAEGYNAWKSALGISLDEYLNDIIKNRETGEWAVDVAKYIIETGDHSVLNL